jgi:predicted RNase H-like HicB family nuclease
MAEHVVTVRVHSEEGSLWATVDEFPGVFATGDTEDELREALVEAVSLYLDTPLTAGHWSSEPPVQERHLEYCEA